jgi:hypothetical protein
METRVVKRTGIARGKGKGKDCPSSTKETPEYVWPMWMIDMVPQRGVTARRRRQPPGNSERRRGSQKAQGCEGPGFLGPTAFARSCGRRHGRSLNAAGRR